MNGRLATLVVVALVRTTDECTFSRHCASIQLLPLIEASSCVPVERADRLLYMDSLLRVPPACGLLQSVHTSTVARQLNEHAVTVLYRELRVARLKSIWGL